MIINILNAKAGKMMEYILRHGGLIELTVKGVKEKENRKTDRDQEKLK